jgi:hypothetical protein
VNARALVLTAGVASLAAPGCGPAPAPPPGGAPLVEVARAARLAGDWRWRHESTDDGVRRVEREHWLLVRDGLTRLRGSYLREVDVEVTTDDGLVFACNQRPRYQQVARFDVVGVVGPAGVELEEVGYQAVPSPCEPGLRRLARYRARLDRTGHLVLVGDASVARLWNGDGAPPPPLPAPTSTIGGAWSWSMGSWTADGRVQREVERWQLEVDGVLVRGGYTRVVTIVDPDGAIIPCAGADRYSFTDRYAIVGKVADDGWRLREDDVVAGDHPCLAGTPTRTIDEATAALDGEYLVLTWRGPRRQVLARPALPADLPW